MEEAFNKLAEVLSRKLQVRQESQRGDYRGIQLQPYEESVESFENYMQRLENYLDLRNLSDETDDGDKACVKILINCVGPRIYQTLSCLTAPDKPNTKKYAELVKLLRQHFCPIPNVISEQHKFAMRIQHEGESVSQYQAELKRLTTNCKFTCEHCQKSTVLTHLRSQFIRGLRDDDIRELLLQQDGKKTFEDAVQLALSIETSKFESRGIRNELLPESVNAVNYTRRKAVGTHKRKKKGTGQSPQADFTQIRCFRCGKNGHKANECKSRNLKCFKCKRNMLIKG